MMLRVNGRALDYPAAETYDKLTPDEIKAICDSIQQSWCRGPHSMESWEEQTPARRLNNRQMAYWAIRGAEDPVVPAMHHGDIDGFYLDPVSRAEYKANGWFAGTSLRELEQCFLPKPTPDANLIIERCPQMAMIHALRGNVSEPYWWAALSITEHAMPNLSRECSDGYPGFSDEELAYRVGRIHKDEIKPALCERLDKNNPKVCNICKFKGAIRSPMALGYEHEPKHKKAVP